MPPSAAASPRRAIGRPLARSLPNPSPSASSATINRPARCRPIICSTLTKPATARPARRARPRSASARSSRSRSTRSGRSAAGRTAAPVAPLADLANRFLATACSIALRSARTHMPRPGSRRARSGTTSPCGPTTKRIIRSGVPSSPVAMQVRNGPVTAGAVGSGWVMAAARAKGVVLRSGLGRIGGRGVLGREPVLAGLHDDGVGGVVIHRALAHDLAQLVGSEIGEVVARLHALLAQRHDHRQGEALGRAHVLVDAQLFETRAQLGVALLDIFAGTALQLGGDLLVEALDAGQVFDRGLGDVLDGAITFGHQQMGDDVVDIKRGLEQLGALAGFLLAALALLGLGHDVDFPAGELGGELDVLAAAADGEAQLIVGHDDLGLVLLLVHQHLADLGRGQRIDDEVRGIVRPRDDVDLLALQLLHDGLYAAAAHADAGTDRIDRAVVAQHRDLGAAARAARLFAHVEDVGAHPVVHAQRLARDGLVAADHAFGALQVDGDVAVVDPLDHARHDLADAILEFLVLPLALAFAHALGDDLLGGLGGNAAEIDRRQLV